MPKPKPYHNPHRELIDVLNNHFKLREVDVDNYFRLIPSGNLGLPDYDRGLCWVKLSAKLRQGAKGKSISLIVGNIDDGLWRAETEAIDSNTQIDEYLNILRLKIGELIVLPTENELNILLSTAVAPYLLFGEFE